MENKSWEWMGSKKRHSDSRSRLIMGNWWSMSISTNMDNMGSSKPNRWQNIENRSGGNGSWQYCYGGSQNSSSISNGN